MMILFRYFTLLQTPSITLCPHTNPSPCPSSPHLHLPFPCQKAPRRRKEPSLFTPPQPYPTDPAIRRSTRVSRKPGEWWKVDLSTLHKQVDSTEEEESQEGDQETIYEEAQEYQDAEVSQESLLSQGLDFVYPLETEMDLPTTLEFAFNTRVTSHPDEPRTFSEAIKRPDRDK
ncbi:hypothetical protein NLI96_g12125 [Meripilus lineatus]|uniref:Uncharacterized protein n=1 Tax=Meripilus lineatus TaxID=2056292 RepID=A0AAD5Y7W0_9APHY|nr:hypothetical protein NLI96_g12125 [Physisporinus lineatus]